MSTLVAKSHDALSKGVQVPAVECSELGALGLGLRVCQVLGFRFQGLGCLELSRLGLGFRGLGFRGLGV